MARMKLQLPASFRFSTEIPVRITDINYGGHLANDAVLSIVHEARVRFLASLGYTEADIEGVSIIMTDAVIVYKAESFYGDVLRAEVDLADPTELSCDIVFRLTNSQSGREIARVKTGIAFFDYTTRKPVPMPQGFRARL